MVVDGVVQERVAAAVLLHVRSRSPSEHAVPATVRDAAKLLDVHVHELTGSGDLVADGLQLTHR